MIRAWTVVLGLSLVGCAAKTAPVEMSMMRNMADDVSSLELTSVELNHAKDGWVPVSMGSAMSTENGASVSLGSADLPRGTYSGARVKYARTTERPSATKTITRTPPASEDGGDDDGTKTITRTEPKAEAGKMEKETDRGMTQTDATFCVDKGDNAVTLTLEDKGDNVALMVAGPGC